MNTPKPILYLHDSAWAAEFAALWDAYVAALGDLILQIDHVGSTSIPGIQAKPILDINVVMQDYEVFPKIVEVLGGLGYTHQGDRGCLHREAFRDTDGPAPRTSPARLWMAHHLYVCPVYTEELRRQFKFRDTLRVRADLRQEYERMKLDIVSRANGQRKIYVQLKSVECKAFVDGVCG